VSTKAGELHTSILVVGTYHLRPLADTYALDADPSNGPWQ